MMHIRLSSIVEQNPTSYEVKNKMYVEDVEILFHLPSSISLLYLPFS